MHISVFNLRRGYPVLFFLALCLFCTGGFFFVRRSYTAYDSAGVLAFAPADTAVPKVVILDAGHGGEDVGATGVSGVFEKDLNLAVTKYVGDYLTAEGYTVIYTRTDDRLLYTPEENVPGLRKISDLKNRCALSQKYPGALFVSIHMNAFGKPGCRGLQVYYAAGTEGSRALADAVQGEVRTALQPENHRKIKEGQDIYVLEHATAPAVLVECGFISNPEECASLSDEDYQKKLGFAIACGILQYSAETEKG